MLKKVLVAASTLAVALVTLTLVVLLGTVTHADAVGYSDWIEATHFTNPLPGQLYAVSADGEIEGQLCPLVRDDFRIETDALPARTFVNRLGEAVPMVVSAANIYFSTGQPGAPQINIGYRLEWHALGREFAPLSALTVGLQRILDERDMEQIRRQASAAQVAEQQRLEGCADAIFQTFHHGLEVCQLEQVISEGAGRILAVRFSMYCLTDPQRGPRPLPDLRARSFWTSVKLSLGLVAELQSAPAPAPVVAGNEAG